MVNEMLHMLLNILMFCFASDSINSEITEYVIKSLPGYDKYEVKIISLKPKTGFEIDNTRELSRNSNLVYVPVQYSLKSGSKSNGVITCEVKLFKKVFVAAHDINNGEKISTNDVDVIEYDIAKLNNVCKSLNELENKRASKYIKKGELLSTNVIEEIPQIFAGQMIVLHSINGMADVQIDAVAQQDGYVDKIIRVKTRDNRLYKAKVIDNKNVLINE